MLLRLLQQHLPAAAAAAVDEDLDGVPLDSPGAEEDEEEDEDYTGSEEDEEEEDFESLEEEAEETVPLVPPTPRGGRSRAARTAAPQPTKGASKKGGADRLARAMTATGPPVQPSRRIRPTRLGPATAAAAVTAPPKKKARTARAQPFVASRERGVQSYQIHPDIKNDIADVLELIRIEIRKCPERHIQVRNRTAASITKRYLYECDLKKLQRCLEDANRLLEKYRAANALKYTAAATVAPPSSSLAGPADSLERCQDPSR